VATQRGVGMLDRGRRLQPSRDGLRRGAHDRARRIEAARPRRRRGSVHERSYAAGRSAPIGASDSLT
jgi:hypothetical protein